jgi:hypothetical protein
MAAVTGSMEEGPIVEGAEGFSGFGAEPRSQPRDMASMHRSLTKTHWLRASLGWYLSKVKLRHELVGGELMLRIVDAPLRDADGAYIPRNVVGWSQMGAASRLEKVWSFSNSKMDCPSFDLPTGAGVVGGTCPGAQEGQSINPGRRGVLPDGTKVDLPRAICMSCYGEGGPIAYTNNQVRQMLRHIWSAGMSQPAHADLFAQVLTQSILDMPEKVFSPGRTLPAPGGIQIGRAHV